MKTGIPTYPIEPNGKWRIIINSPEGYGFDATFATNQEFVDALDALRKAGDSPEGVAAAVREMVEFLQSE